jgi:hypothetical protein
MNMHTVRMGAIAAALSLVMTACGANEDASGRTSKGGLDLGLSVSDDATAKDVGLPQYPGSQPYEDKREGSSSAANVGFSSPLFGLKVVAVKLETSDEPEKVAAFYRQALSKYGTVLDCSDPEASKGGAKKDDELECDADELDEHSAVYKVGTEEHQRVAAIKPHGRGTRFALVYVDVRGDSKD